MMIKFMSDGCGNTIRQEFNTTWGWKETQVTKVEGVDSVHFDKPVLLN